MLISFYIVIGMAVGGLLFNGFSSNSLLSFSYILATVSPLLLLSKQIQEPRLVAPAAQWLRVLGPTVAFVGACFAPVSIIHAQGYGVTDMLSMEKLTAVAIQTTVDRYTLGRMEDTPVLVAAGMANAFMWPLITTKPSRYIVFGLLPAAFYSVITTAKWPFYCSLSFFFTAMLLRAPTGRKEGRSIGQVGLVALGGATVGIVAIAVRKGLSEVPAMLDSMGEIAFSFGHYMFAQYETFGAWLRENATYCCDLGRWSFSGPMDFFGFAVREQGVFSDFMFVAGEETNLYTAWRYVVQDFSVLGPPLLMLGVAASYRSAIQSRWWRAAVFLQVLLVLSAFLQTSATLAVHNSVLLAACCCGLWAQALQVE